MDNRYTELHCPPRVSDGRHFTDYHPRDTLNDYYQTLLHTKNNEHQYRKELQNKGMFIRDGNLKYFMNTNKCDCKTFPCDIKEKFSNSYNYQFERLILMTDKLSCPPKDMYGLK